MQRFLLASCALACAPALAAFPEDWGPEVGVVRERDGFGVWAHAGGPARYWFRTPAGAREVRVLAVGKGDDADLIVRRDSPDTTPVCRLGGTHNATRVCTISLPKHATRAAIWYVEMPGAF